eukprot:PhM_4_TR5280/c0_g1_i1/m.34528
MPPHLLTSLQSIQNEFSALNDTSVPIHEAISERLQRIVDCMSRLETHVEALKTNEHVPHDIESVEDIEFELGVEVARIKSHVKTLNSKICEAREADGNARCVIASELAFAFESEASLRSRVLELEEKDRRGAILASGIFDEFKTTVETPREANCACCTPGSSQSESCPHRQRLASHIIDHTFDAHKRLLREKLRLAEVEIAKLKSGTWLQDALKERDDEIEDLRKQLHDANAMAVRSAQRAGANNLAARVAYDRMAEHLMAQLDEKFESVNAALCVDAVGQITLWARTVLVETASADNNGDTFIQTASLGELLNLIVNRLHEGRRRSSSSKENKYNVNVSVQTDDDTVVDDTIMEIPDAAPIAFSAKLPLPSTSTTTHAIPYGQGESNIQRAVIHRRGQGATGHIHRIPCPPSSALGGASTEGGHASSSSSVVRVAAPTSLPLSAIG